MTCNVISAKFGALSAIFLPKIQQPDAEECLRRLAQTVIINVSALMREPHGEAFL
jgi:hypothetical protein